MKSNWSNKCLFKFICLENSSMIKFIVLLFFVLLCFNILFQFLWSWLKMRHYLYNIEFSYEWFQTTKWALLLGLLGGFPMKEKMLHDVCLKDQKKRFWWTLPNIKAIRLHREWLMEYYAWPGLELSMSPFQVIKFKKWGTFLKSVYNISWFG